jgi:hypothetical protein
MWPFDQIGAGIGDLIASAFDAAMTAIWNAALDLLHAAFNAADQFSVFSVSTTTGPIKVIWPMMLWISGILAIALFFWQMIVTNLHAGRGFLRLVTGPVQYGVTLAVTVGLVASFLAAVDGITDGILNYGLQSKNFVDAFSHTTFAGAIGHGVKASVLGIIAIGGIVPAALGYVLEMLFREAAIYVLVGGIPLVAAGLLANVTAQWLWRTARWLAAAIAMKPVLALALVLGVAIAGGSQGLSGLLAGVGVLVVSLIAPFVLFRLFAFVDPGSDAGGAFRDFLSSRGLDSYGSHNPTSAMAGVAGGGGAIESANTGRFDDALAEQAEDSMDGTGVGEPSENDIGPDEHQNDAPVDDDAGRPSRPPPANAGSVVGSSPSAGYVPDDDPPTSDSPDEGDGGSRPDDDSGGPGEGPGAGAAAEEAAVIL